jgi:hypothetical protein
MNEMQMFGWPGLAGHYRVFLSFFDASVGQDVERRGDYQLIRPSFFRLLSVLGEKRQGHKRKMSTKRSR